LVLLSSNTKIETKWADGPGLGQEEKGCVEERRRRRTEEEMVYSWRCLRYRFGDDTGGATSQAYL
jgi:hypothetical protein